MAEFVLTAHARSEAQRRGIPEDLVLRVAASPQQIVAGFGGLRVHQSAMEFGDGGRYLLRVIVNSSVQPARIVTVYRTSKIDKYWSPR